MSRILLPGILQQTKNNNYITDGLVLYIDAKKTASYPGTGSNVYDISGSGNHGSISGTVTYSTRYNGLFNFNKTDGTIIFNPLDPAADGLFADASSEWTVSSWFIPDIEYATESAVNGLSGGLAGTYFVSQISRTLNASLRGGTRLNVSTNLTNSLNEIVITWDGTTAKAYLNGQFVNNITVGTGNQQTFDFTIGSLRGGNNRFFGGSVSDTKVYNRALNASEVLHNYNVFISKVTPVISWQGLDYYPVESTTGKTWLDRNLGATRAAIERDDTSSYGDYFQWGRYWDGHESITSGTTTTNATTAVPNNGNSWDGMFILESSSPYDWLTTQDNTLWQGVNGTNNPCPPGYRIPTQTEWNAEIATFSTNDYTGAFNSPLRISTAGSRARGSGVGNSVGSIGFYWASTVSGTQSKILFSQFGVVQTQDQDRAQGCSVRCICDAC